MTLGPARVLADRDTEGGFSGASSNSDSGSEGSFTDYEDESASQQGEHVSRGGGRGSESSGSWNSSSAMAEER